MQEYRCSGCGYRKTERDRIDVMGEFPMYFGFVGGFMPRLLSDLLWHEDLLCPNCGEISTWRQ